MSHQLGCPRLTDPDATCACGFRSPAGHRWVSHSRAVELWGEWLVARLRRDGSLLPVVSGYWITDPELASEVVPRD